MLLYLDNCSLNRPFDLQNQMRIILETEAKLYIQSKIIDKTYKLAWSYMLDLENRANPYKDKRNAIFAWKNRAIVFQSAHDEVLALGKQYLAKNIAPKDALHLACAVMLECDYFITTDKSLLNKAFIEVVIINPIDFIREKEI